MDFVCILVICVFITAYWYWKVPNNLPPGSAGIPILGYLPFLNLKIHSLFIKLGKKYGNVFYLYFGSSLTIFLNDFAAIKEAFVKQADVFSGRAQEEEFNEVFGDRPGIALTDGDYWSQHRRFLIRNLKSFGVGTAAMEPVLLDEINHFLTKIRHHSGESIRIRDYFFLTFTNNIQILVTKQRFDCENPTLHRITASVKTFEYLATLFPLKKCFPWASPLIHLFFPKRLNKIRSAYKEIISVIEDSIREEKSKLIDGQNENYLQAYFTEQNSRLKANANENVFTDIGLLHDIQDLYVAGVSTTANTLTWATHYMALHPDVQKRVQSEIDDVIGRHREPSYADRINTPYTEATICEIYRVSSVLPFSLAHRPTRDTTLLGHPIPKGANIIPNLYAVHHDVTLWGDPENFRPERFIGPKGECVKPEYLIPFGVGKRSCAGEQLARMEIYLYFVSLLQHFDFVPPPGVKLTLEPSLGVSRGPKCHVACAKPRQL